jgi:preprotein translocase SecE subunit
MHKYQKYVNALFIAAGALIWFLAQHYTGVVIGYFQLGRKLGAGADVMEQVVPLIFCVATFVILRQNKASYNFSMDATAELAKTSWPGQKEVRIGTIVVIITVLLSGLVLGGLDLIFTHIVRALLGA